MNDGFNQGRVHAVSCTCRTDKVVKGISVRTAAWGAGSGRVVGGRNVGVAIAVEFGVGVVGDAYLGEFACTAGVLLDIRDEHLPVTVFVLIDGAGMAI